MLSGFPYGRTQHVRRMHFSTISVIHCVYTRYFTSHVMSGSATCSFLVQK